MKLTEVELDLEAVFPDPKKAAHQWLKRYCEKREQDEVPKMQKQKGNEGD